MAVTLNLSYVERNDNKLITLADTSDDWGTPAIVDITTLTLDVTITTSDNVSTTYDQINLVDEFGDGVGAEFDDQDALSFPLTCAHFINSDTSVALGTSADVFPDGIYQFTYTLDDGLATDSELVENVLMEGVVRNQVYEDLRALPVLYNCNECKSKQIMDAIFAYGYLNSIRAAGYVAKTEELLSQLYVLERLTSYGSSYTW